MILMIGLAVAGWLGAGLFFGLWIWSRRTARESVRVVGGINHESRELLVREVDELARALKVEQRRAEEFFTKINDAVPREIPGRRATTGKASSTVTPRI